MSMKSLTITIFIVFTLSWSGLSQSASMPPTGADIVNQGGSPFCVLTSYGSLNCWYWNANTCRQAAASSGGMCVPNPNIR